MVKFLVFLFAGHVFLLYIILLLCCPCEPTPILRSLLSGLSTALRTERLLCWFYANPSGIFQFESPLFLISRGSRPACSTSNTPVVRLDRQTQHTCLDVQQRQQRFLATGAPVQPPAHHLDFGSATGELEKKKYLGTYF